MSDYITGVDGRTYEIIDKTIVTYPKAETADEKAMRMKKDPLSSAPTFSFTVARMRRRNAVSPSNKA